MDILVVNCNTSPVITEAIRDAAQAVARPGTHITAVEPAWGVASAEGYYDSFISAAAVLDVLATWTGPVDAVVMAGFGEHGREGARQLLDVPVVDITEAAAIVAGLVGGSYGVVTTTPTSIQQIRHSLATAGLWERCAGIRATGMRVLGLHADHDHTVDAFVETSRALIAEGADAIVLGCAGLAGLQQQVQARLDVPVVDGVTAAVTLCESLVQLGLRTSKVGPYTTPDLTKVRPGWPAGTPMVVNG